MYSGKLAAGEVMACVSMMSKDTSNVRNARTSGSKRQKVAADCTFSHVNSTSISIAPAVSPIDGSGGRKVPAQAVDVDHSTITESSSTRGNTAPWTLPVCHNTGDAPPVIGGRPLWESVLHIEDNLLAALKPLYFGELVTHVYFPTEYAREPHSNFTRRYCSGKKRILFLGMNPGPFGMVQTGVPFGDAPTVKGWLNISGHVEQPSNVHPKRPILGLECQRQEVSGSRFWGYFQKLGPPDQFFENCFVYNMCPAAFMSHSGKNVIPAQLKAAEQRILNEICQHSLASLVELLETELVIAIGQFAYKGALKALADSIKNNKIKVECILHPSPRNPRANKGWSAIVTEQFQKMGVADCLGITAEAAALFTAMKAEPRAADDSDDDMI